MGSPAPRLSGTPTGSSSEAALGSSADSAQVPSRLPRYLEQYLEQYLPLAGARQVVHSKEEGKEAGEPTSSVGVKMDTFWRTNLGRRHRKLPPQLSSVRPFLPSAWVKIYSRWRKEATAIF